MSTNLIKTLDTVESSEVVSRESSSVKVVENQSDLVKVSVGEDNNTENFNGELGQLKDKGRRIGIKVRKTELLSIIKEVKEILVEKVVGMGKQEDEGVSQVVEQGKNKGMVSNTIEENLNDGAGIAVEIEPESAGVTEPVGHLLDRNLGPGVRVKGVQSLEDERKIVQVNGNLSCTDNDSLEADKPGNVAEVSETLRIDSRTVVENFDEGIHVTIYSSSVAITESIVEEAQVVEGGEVAMMDCDELFVTREVVVPGTNAVAGNPSSLDDNQSVEAQAVGGIESECHMASVDGDLASDVLMTEENGSVNKRQRTGIEIVEGGVSSVKTEIQIQKTQVVDGDTDMEAQTAGGPSKSTASGNLCHGDETSTQDGKQHTFVPAGEPVSHQVDGVEKMDSCPVNENLDDGVHATVDPSLLHDGSQHTGRVIENRVLGDGMLPDVPQENGAEINEVEGATDFSVLVLDEELISDIMDVDNFEGNNIEMGDNFAGFEHRKSMEQQVVKTETLKPEPTARYDLIPGRENEFSVHNPEDQAHPHNRKEKSLSDLMATKKPDIDNHNHADVDSTAPQSFKAGECIRRIASQLTGGPPILKSGSKNLQKKGVAFLKKYSCPDLLSKLHLAARDHKKGRNVLTVIRGFFSEFRNSSSLNYVGLKQRKKSEHRVGSAEPFDFQDTNDSYWTDRTVQNTSDEHAEEKNSEGKEETDLKANPTPKDNVSQAPGNPPHLVLTKVVLGDVDKELTLSTRKNRKRKENIDQENPLLSSDPGPSTKKSSSRRSRKEMEPPLAPTDTNANQLNDVQEKKGPTALLLKFTEPYPVPSVTNLNKMFCCFGPLKDSETAVVKDKNSAIVVFKTYRDAEVALSSAGKFSIFGPGVVSYELSCFPLPPPKVSVGDTTQGSHFLKLLEEASLCDTTQGGDNVKLLKEASLCDATQGGDNVKVLEESSLCETTQGS